MDFDVGFGYTGGLAQESGLLGICFDQVDLAGAEDGQNQTRKSGAAAQVEENPGGPRRSSPRGRFGLE